MLDFSQYLHTTRTQYNTKHKQIKHNSYLDGTSNFKAKIILIYIDLVIDLVVMPGHKVLFSEFFVIGGFTICTTLWCLMYRHN